MHNKKEKTVNKILVELINNSFTIENQFLPKRFASSKNIKEVTKILTLKNALLAWGKILVALKKKHKPKKVKGKKKK